MKHISKVCASSADKLIQSFIIMHHSMLISSFKTFSLHYPSRSLWDSLSSGTDSLHGDFIPPKYQGILEEKVCKVIYSNVGALKDVLVFGRNKISMDTASAAVEAVPKGLTWRDSEGQRCWLTLNQLINT